MLGCERFLESIKLMEELFDRVRAQKGPLMAVWVGGAQMNGLVR